MSRSRKGIVERNGYLLKKRDRKPSKRSAGGVAFDLDWIDHDDWPIPYLDASWLVAEVSAAIHEAHVRAIRDGVRAGSGQPQPPLDPHGQSGREAAEGKRPRERGVARRDGRSLPDRLLREKIKARANAKLGKGRVGTAATAVIKPGSGGHSQFLSKEASERGIEYLDTDGQIDKIIDEAIQRYLDAAIEGPPEDLSRLNFDSITGRGVK